MKMFSKYLYQLGRPASLTFQFVLFSNINIKFQWYWLSNIFYCFTFFTFGK